MPCRRVLFCEAGDVEVGQVAAADKSLKEEVACDAAVQASTNLTWWNAVPSEWIANPLQPSRGAEVPAEHPLEAAALPDATAAPPAANRPAPTAEAIDWLAVLEAGPEAVAEAIQGRGMHRLLARNICRFLAELRATQHGLLSLEWLHDASTAEAKAFLTGISGLGPKCAACVQLLALRRPVFPVDVNVGRICQRLGWIPLDSSGAVEELEDYAPEPAVQEFLAERLNTLPPALLRELHYQMITLGKVFCTKRRPNCGGCPVRGVCEYANHRGPRWQPREAVQCSDIEETIPADTADLLSAPVFALPNCSRPGAPYLRQVPGGAGCVSHVYPVARPPDSGLAPWLPPLHPHDRHPYLALLWSAVYVPHDEDGKFKNSSSSNSSNNNSNCTEAGNSSKHCISPVPYTYADTIVDATVKTEAQDGAWVTFLVPCRTVTRGRFPLDGTFFQTNEVFLDAHSLQCPVWLPRACLAPAPVRLYSGTSLTSLCKGMSQEEVTTLFHGAYLCTRAFEPFTMTHRGLPPWLT
eukprot:EG_transcript_3422